MNSAAEADMSEACACVAQACVHLKLRRRLLAPITHSASVVSCWRQPALPRGSCACLAGFSRVSTRRTLRRMRIPRLPFASGAPSLVKSGGGLPRRARARNFRPLKHNARLAFACARRHALPKNELLRTCTGEKATSSWLVVLLVIQMPAAASLCGAVSGI